MSVPLRKPPIGSTSATAGNAVAWTDYETRDCPLLSLREWFSPENVALFLVCVADMVSTLYWIHAGVAEEANPMFAAWLHQGVAPFIGMKFLSFMPLIAVSTYYRRRRPRLIAFAMRVTVIIYLVLYCGRFMMQWLYGV